MSGIIYEMMMIFVFQLTDTLNWSFTLLVYWNNIPRGSHSCTLSYS